MKELLLLLSLFFVLKFSPTFAQNTIPLHSNQDRKSNSDNSHYLKGSENEIIPGYSLIDFETPAFPPAGWTCEFTGTQYWNRLTTCSGYGVGAASARFYSYTAAAGISQSLISSTFTPAIAGDSLKFDHAYATYLNENDKLEIYYSTDGGTAFNLLVLLNGGTSGELVTAPANTFSFIPNSTQWATKKYGLPIGTNKIKFKATSDNGNNIYIDNIKIGMPPANDVGIQSLDMSTIYPLGSVTPKATVKNYGSSLQTSFDVILTLTGGYTSTKTVTSLAPDAVLQVTFDNWTPDLGTFNAKVYTMLTADDNSNNDTLTSIINISDFFWQQLPATPNALSRSCCVYVMQDTNDYIYQFGGGGGTQYVSVARYDVNAATWSLVNTTIPSNMSAATAVAVGDSNIYLIGGEAGGGLGKTYRFNHYTNVWTLMANMPSPVTDALVAKFWNNNLIYVIGGGDGILLPPTYTTNAVQIYNIQTNSWSVGTPLPVALDMLAGGIINDKIITAGGWNGSRAVSDVYIGTINLDNPTQITWVNAGKYPADTLQGIKGMASFPVAKDVGQAAGVVFAGGSVGLSVNGSAVIKNAYMWNYCTNQWSAVPSIPVGRTSFKMASKYLPSTYYGNEVYTVAGYSGAAGVGNFDKLTIGTMAGSCYTLIPVELVSFTSRISGNNIILNWSTATETNNKGFEVERKSEGGSFLSLGFINGKGTTTESQSYKIVDYNLPPGNYIYRLKQIDLEGTMSYSKEILAVVSTPAEFSLSQNYPNPFNSSTSIKFSLKSDSKVSLKIFNILGQQLASLINSDLKAGNYNQDYNASDLSSGVYLYSIEAVGSNGQIFKETKKLVLLK